MKWVSRFQLLNKALIIDLNTDSGMVVTIDRTDLMGTEDMVVAAVDMVDLNTVAGMVVTIGSRSYVNRGYGSGSSRNGRSQYRRADNTS